MFHQGTKILGYFLAELDVAGTYSLAAKKYNGPVCSFEHSGRRKVKRENR
jgi:hypothetical protein